jgi:putative ABC transport system permease protein
VSRLWLRTAADVVRRAPVEHLDLLRQDVLYALRLLRRHPGATTTAIVSLAVGIGLNAAIYSVVGGVLWRSLPFAESDRLVMVGPVTAGDPKPDFLDEAQVLDVTTRARALDGVAAGVTRSVTLVEPGPPVDIRGLGVTPSFFDVLRVRPVLGRGFDGAEYDAARAVGRTTKRWAAPTVAIISDRLWRTRFASRADVVGARIRVAGGDIIEVVGVMGPEIETLGRALSASDYWFPAEPAVSGAGRIGRIWLTIARLAAGRTTADANAELAVIGGTLEPDFFTKEPRILGSVGLLDLLIGGVRTQMLFLFGAVACVLLVTCANVANLFLAQAAGRRDELGVRAALGASRIRLLRQAVTESLVVSLIGGAAGYALAVLGVPALIAMAPADVPRLQDVGVDWSTFVFTFGVAAAIGIVCALVAALPLRQVPKAMGRVAQTSAPPTNRFRHAVTVAEIALALMLTVAATLMVRTVRALNAIDLGFDPRGVVTADLSARVTSLAQAQTLHSTIIDQVKTLPGVTQAGIGIGPLSGGMFTGGVQVPGNPRTFDTLAVDAVSPGYFEALGARLQAGRFFDARDTAPNGRSAILLNETAARLFFPDANPIGRTIVINDTQEQHVIGVVADLRGTTLVGPPGPMMYQLSHQSKNFLANNMLIRVDGEDDHLAAAIGSIIHALNREAPFRGVEPLRARIDRAMAPRLFVLRLIGLFSLVGLALAVVGVYSVLAQFVGQRVPEIGVRVAFGATVRDVLRLVFGQGARLVCAGLVLGIAGAVLLRDVMTTMLYGVDTLDPLAYSGACVLLLAATAAACAVPARRAARLDPVVALRSE